MRRRRRRRCFTSRKSCDKTNKLHVARPPLPRKATARPGWVFFFYVNLLMLKMFGCRVTLISEKRCKGRRLLTQTNTPSVNFFFFWGWWIIIYCGEWKAWRPAFAACVVLNGVFMFRFWRESSLKRTTLRFLLKYSPKKQLLIIWRFMMNSVQFIRLF